jgi:hypothetical protein
MKKALVCLHQRVTTSSKNLVSGFITSANPASAAPTQNHMSQTSTQRFMLRRERRTHGVVYAASTTKACAVWERTRLVHVYIQIPSPSTDSLTTHILYDYYHNQ